MAFKDIILAVTMAVKKAKAYTDSKTSGIGGGVNYKGSVNYYSNLPANPEEGDAYTVKYAGSSGAVVDGTEYVWGLNTDTNTMEWIEWSKDCYTKAETDSLLNGKQSTIDITHKLDGSLVGPLTGYMAATIADALDPTDTLLQALGKLERAADNNKINISSNWGVAKNLLVNRGSLNSDNITYTWVNGDVSVTGAKASEHRTYVAVMPPTPLSDLGLSDKVVISNNGTNCYLAVLFLSNTLGLSSRYEIVSGSNIIDVPSGYTHIMAQLGVNEGVTGSINETIQPMICTKAQWDISHEYQPSPFSNAELTSMLGNINTVLEGVL
jgi:hypothetical protein